MRKKLLSLVLAIGMILSMITVPTMAATSENGLTIDLEVFRYPSENTPTTLAQLQANKINLETDSLNKGESIVVGIKYSGMQKLTQYGYKYFSCDLDYTYDYFEPTYLANNALNALKANPSQTRTYSWNDAGKNFEKPFLPSQFADDIYKLNGSTDFYTRTEADGRIIRSAYMYTAVSENDIYTLDDVITDDTGYFGFLKFNVTNAVQAGKPATFALSTVSEGQRVAFGMGIFKEGNPVQENYDMSIPTYANYISKGNVCNSPITVNIIDPANQPAKATDFTADTKTAIANATRTIDASNADNTETKLIAALPATGKVATNKGDKDVKLTWTLKTGTYNVKGGTYTYEATVAAANTGDNLDLTSITKPTATVTVNAVTATWGATFADKTAQVDEEVTLPASGSITAGGTTVNYTVVWNPATIDTTSAGDKTSTGTVTFTNAPAWMTMPSTTVTQKYVVSERPKTMITAVTNKADKTVYSREMKDDAAVKAHAATITELDATPNTKVTVTWGEPQKATANGQTTYTFTGTVAPKDAVNYAVTEGLTAQYKVIVKQSVATITGQPGANATIRGLSDSAYTTASQIAISANLPAKLNVTYNDGTAAGDANITYTAASIPADFGTVDGGTVTLNWTAAYNAAAGVNVNGAVSGTVAVKVEDKKIASFTNPETVTFKANDAKNTDMSTIIAALPQKVSVKYEGETETTEITANWQQSMRGKFDPQGGEYTFTDPSIKVVRDGVESVATVDVKVSQILLNGKIAENADVYVAPVSVAYASYADMGLPVGGTLKDSENNSYNYTINWTTSIPEGFGLTEDAEKVFAGEVVIKTANDGALPAWLTIGEDIPETIERKVIVKKVETSLNLGTTSVAKGKTSYSDVTVKVNGKKADVVKVVEVSSANSALSVKADGKRIALTGKTVKKDIPVTVTALVKYDGREIEVTGTDYVTVKTSGGGGGGGVSYGSGNGNVGTYVPEEVTYFDDIDTVPWAEDYINLLAKNNFVQGVAPRIFAPDDNVTRAELVKMLVEIFGLTEADEDMNYVDMTDDSAWYYNYVAIGTKAGIVNGYEEDNTFRPENNVSREEMAAMIGRACAAFGAELPEKAEAQAFDDDADIQEYAKAYVTQLQKAAIIEGMGDGTYSPAGNATRAQAAKVVGMIYNIISK